MIEAVEGPLWLQIVYAAVAGLITLLLLPYLKRKAEAAKAEAMGRDLCARDILLKQIKIFLLEEASIIAEQKFPRLAKTVLAQDLKAPVIKQMLREWGLDLRDRAKSYFRTQGLDLVGAIGDEYLDRLIRWAADKTSPFPGKVTAVALMEKEWSNRIVDFGVDWVRENYLPKTEPKPAEDS